MKVLITSPISLPVQNGEGNDFLEIDLCEKVFNCDYNEALVHQVLTAYNSNARSGNRAQKDRSDVKHSTRKPWKQKGTGHARAGMRSSPLWRGGGKIFPNSPEENFEKKVNRKMYRAAMSVMLSQLFRENRVVIVDNIEVSLPKTKKFLNLISNFGLNLTQCTLIVVDSISDNLYLSSRNLANVMVVEAKHVTPLVLVRCKKLVITKTAVEALGSRLTIKNQCLSN